MKTDFDFQNPTLLGPKVFQPSFNQFETVNGTQAWSLFFTASQEDKALGDSPELGRFFTNAIVAIATAGIIGVAIFQNVLGIV